MTPAYLATPDPFGWFANPVLHWVIVVVAMVLLVFVILTASAYTVFWERVYLGYVQRRPGPNRVGPFGLLQMAADGVKLAFKESFLPGDVDPVLFVVAPMVAVASAFLVWAVIPVGIWYGITYWIADLNIGILLVLAVTSMNVYAIMLGGWASNSKYSILGGLRAAAQLISYEMAMGLSLVPLFILTGSLRIQDIVDYTVRIGGVTLGPGFPMVLVAPVSFLLYLIAAVAETNRAPFDLPEAEQELVGGFLTEYSGLKFTMFYLGEYTAVLTQSTLLSLLFFGGWHLWIIPPVIAFFLKVFLFVTLYIWIRATFPRLRYDMLMRLGWKVLLPLGMANVIVTAIVAVALG